MHHQWEERVGGLVQCIHPARSAFCYSIFHGEREKMSEITRVLKEMYGKCCYDESMVREWTRLIHKRRIRLEDEAHSGRPSDCITFKHIVLIFTLLNNVARFTLSELVMRMRLDCRCSYIPTIVHNVIKYRKSSVREFFKSQEQMWYYQGLEKLVYP